MNKLYFTRVVEKTRGLFTSREGERERESTESSKKESTQNKEKKTKKQKNQKPKTN